MKLLTLSSTVFLEQRKADAYLQHGDYDDATIDVHAVAATHASSKVLFEKEPDKKPPKEWKDVPAMIRAAIIKVHNAHGHAPYKESLAKFLQHSGASQEAVAAGRLFRCDTCESRCRHADRPNAARPKYSRFNEALTMDFMILPDVERQQHCVLVIVDIASDFVVCRYVCPGTHPTASQANLAMEEAWFGWAGPPQYGILLDDDTAFRKQFAEAMESLGVPLILASPEAHWQMGKVEGKIRILKEMTTRVFAENSVKGEIPVRIAVGKMASAHNALVTNAGFSPSQWVLGSGRRLPASLCNHDNDLVVSSRVIEGS